MSSSAPTVKDVNKAVTTDLHAFLATDKPKEHDSPRETIQQYLDRFVKSNSSATTAHHASAPAMPSSAGAHYSSTPVLGSGGLGVSGAAASTFTNAPIPSSAAPGTGNSTAAGQRHPNELYYQSLTNNATLQHPSNLPFAFHKVSQVTSSSGSPSSSTPSSQNVSTIGSPTIGGGGAGGQHSATSGQATPIAGTNPSLSTSPTMQSTSTAFNISNPSANVSLVAQKTSAHLITLYTQHGMGDVPIASVASRMIVYLTHLLPFLTPRLIITDWWDRLIGPSLQGEIKLGKDALKSCRDLVTECMNRDHLLDCHGSGTGTMLVAGDEEGEMDTALAMAVMPIAQFVLRKHIRAAHRLNHRLLETDSIRKELRVDGLNEPWLREKAPSKSTGHAGHGPGLPRVGSTVSYPSLSSDTQRSEYPAVLQDMDTQLRLLTKARAIIRRKQDILVKNLESILFAYGGGVGRVKDFFSCLYTYFVGARYRPEILGLLCQFIRRQRVHLHQILATPLFDSLLLSLKYDTSPLIVSLGLMTLIMLMPRIPAALNDKLPDLFLILSRILCWPRSRHQFMEVANQDGANLTGQTIKSFDEFEDEGIRTNASSDSTHNNKSVESGQPSMEVEFEDILLYSHGIRWRRHGPAKPGGTSEGAPDPTAIFSFMYGLFPCNLLKFLHSPRAYMKQVLTPAGSPKQNSGPHVGEGDFAGNTADGGAMSPKDPTEIALYIDEDLLKSRVQTLLKRHSLHPDLLTLTPEQEIINKARWQKLEPMEIVAMCVGLDVWSAGGHFGTGPTLQSIEEDHRSASRQDSDGEEEDSSKTTAYIPEQSALSEANVSVESLESEESQETPIEILAQEEFFGPRAIKESSARLSHSPSVSSFQRDHGGHGTSATPSPRARTRSKEVKMSQILNNYATLRGLGYDDFLVEVQNSKSLGPSLILREREPSIAKASESTTGPAMETTPATGATAQAACHDNIPSEESTALIASAATDQGSILNPAAMATLVLQNQEYRKSIVYLERDLLMAKNELNFELFLKQQHIQQISKVHRAYVLDASVEAERQNLYNTCRSLKAQLHETKLLLEKEKTELEKRKNKQVHWDTELKNKMQTFRDERKQLQFEVERLKQDITDTRQTQEIQERQLTDERKGTFNLKNSIEELSPKLKRMEEYEKRIEEMTRQLVLWESEQSKMVELQRQMETVIGRWQDAELLLAAEKEEARTLRNRASQQSQILDDMRIQMAMNEGYGPENMPETPSIEHHSEEEGHMDENDEQGNEKENGLRLKPSSDNENMTDRDRSLRRAGDSAERDRSHHRKASSSRRHYNSVLEMNWPTTFNRSNSSQQGFEHQRRAAAMQEFIAREKERWDQELQESHNRWSKEAMRNQLLEDRILELQGQLDIARAIDMRHQTFTGGSQGGHIGRRYGGDGGDGGDIGGGGDGGGGHVLSRMMDAPAQPQNVPSAKIPGPGSGMMMVHDHFGEVDTDDGTESGEMIGRYSRRNHETEDEDDMVQPRTRSANTSPTHGSAFASHNPSSSTGKGKGTKSKSRSKWLHTPGTHERAQTDRGTYGPGIAASGTAALQSHPGSNRPGIFDFGRNLSQQRKSGESSSTADSSTAAARATLGGLTLPMHYTRNMSHLSDGGSSDMTAGSDGSTAGGTSGAGVARDDDAGSTATVSDSKSGSVSGSNTGKKSGKSKAEKERDRERERLRIMSGTGPFSDPTKMYRNVRMF